MSSSPNSSSSSDPLSAAALTLLGDVVCKVAVVLGTARLSVRDCLHLRRHSIIQLNEIAGSDMVVVVNGVAVARGEAVIIEDSTAIRVTDILSPPSTEIAE